MTKRQISWATGGLAMWLVTTFAAFWLGGAGHGWVTPFRVTLPGIALGPLTFVAAFASTPASRKYNFALLVLAAALDLYLLINTNGEDREGLSTVLNYAPVLIVPWAALWLGWHGIIIASLLKRRPTA